MTIHTCLEGILPVLLKGIGRHGKDGNLSLCPVSQLPYLTGCLITIEARHLDVHENEAEIIGGSLLEHPDTLHTICGTLHEEPRLLEYGNSYLGIEVVVLRQQHTPARQGRQGTLGMLLARHHFLLRHAVGSGHREGGSPARLTLDLDGSPHQFHEFLDDGHSQSRTQNLVVRGSTLTREFLKEMRQIILRHTDARV